MLGCVIRRKSCGGVDDKQKFLVGVGDKILSCVGVVGIQEHLKFLSLGIPPAHPQPTALLANRIRMWAGFSRSDGYGVDDKVAYYTQ